MFAEAVGVLLGSEVEILRAEQHDSQDDSVLRVEAKSETIAV